MSDEAKKKVDEEWKKRARDEREAADKGKSGPGADADLPPVSFSLFVKSLATQALIHLGVIGNPLSGKTELNLPQAKYTIDILGMLEEKTRGNLLDEERRELDQLLYDLRLRYVQAGTQRRSN